MNTISPQRTTRVRTKVIKDTPTAFGSTTAEFDIRISEGSDRTLTDETMLELARQIVRSGAHLGRIDFGKSAKDLTMDGNDLTISGVVCAEGVVTGPTSGIHFSAGITYDHPSDVQRLAEMAEKIRKSTITPARKLKR